MLAKANRLVRADDYRGTVRRGSSLRGAYVVAYIVRREVTAAPRFGFIVSKAVGNAVKRNTVRRRLKAASYGVLPSVPVGTDIVFRALPGAADASWASLQREVSRATVTRPDTKTRGRRA